MTSEAVGLIAIAGMILSLQTRADEGLGINSWYRLLRDGLDMGNLYEIATWKIISLTTMRLGRDSEVTMVSRRECTMIRMNAWAEGLSLRGCERSGSQRCYQQSFVCSGKVLNRKLDDPRRRRRPELKEEWGLMVFPLPSAFQYAYGGRGGSVVLG